MILSYQYDQILDELFYVAEQASVYNGKSYLKLMKTTEKMTLAFWLFAYKESGAMSLNDQKRIMKNFEDDLSKKLHLSRFGIGRTNNHFMIEWRKGFYNNLFHRSFSDDDLLHFLTECLTTIEKDGKYLVDYYPSSSIPYGYKSDIEQEASDFLNALQALI